MARNNITSMIVKPVCILAPIWAHYSISGLGR
jgi:hypothetical protein